MVFRFSAMGDVAMSIPVIQSLVRQNKDVEVVFVSRPFFKPLFKDLPHTEFIGVDLKKHKGFFGLYKLFKLLKKEKPDYIADIHNVLRTKILRLFFKSSDYTIAVIDKGRREKKALTRTDNKVFKPLKTTHERYADVFRNLGFAVNTDNFQALKPAISNQVDLFLKTFDTQTLIGIAPFAAHEGKQYPLEKIEALIKIILKRKLEISILLFGGPGEKKMLDELEKINRQKVVNTAGIFSFEEELQLISQLKLMLSMDSGNGHLAALYGVPVMTIWGVTHPFAGFAPFKQPESFQILPDLQKFPQVPTSVYGNKVFDNFEQIWDSISPEIVADKIITAIKT